ncbi:MAG: hypothetical protein JST04_14585 [Bdellovibrionales bacterium]|nr:hypothetical protein [Bdellovibrionales bacterium]
MTTTKKLKLGLVGAGGRMGTEVRKLLAESRFSARIELVAAPGADDPLDPLFDADVWLEFSSPKAVTLLLAEAERRKTKIPFVIGTTGWSPDEDAAVLASAKTMPILRASNFSLGVFLCRAALRDWAGYPELADWRVTMRELHHTRKKDAPSGTALSLREALGREIAITSVREGDIVGIHEVILESATEKLTLVHEAKSRAVFAEGALEAAIRLARATPGMLPKRVLGLEDLYLSRGA